MNEQVLKKLEQEPNYQIKKAVNVLIILGFLVWSFMGIDFSGIKSNGLAMVGKIFSGIFTPDFTLYNLTTNGIPFLLLETLAIGLLGTLMGAVLAIPFGFLQSSNIVPAWFAYIVRIFLIFIRTIPTLVYGLIFIRVVGPGPYAGILTMAITSVGMLSKLFSEAILDINKDILESMSALGMTTFEKIRFGIIPQLSAIFLSTIIYRFDVNIRDATVLGLVGAGGIGAPLIFAISGYKWNQVGSILIGLVILVLIIEYFSTRIRNKLIKGY